MKSDNTTNSHLLLQFDNQVIGNINSKTGERFSVRVIASQDSAKENLENLRILLPIAHETRSRLKSKLSKEHNISEQLIHLERPNDSKAFNYEGIDDFAREFAESFSNKKDDNYTALIVEDTSGRAISAIAFTINDKDKRRELKITDPNSASVFLDLSQTLPDYEGNGILKMVRTYFIPKVLSDSEIEGKAFLSSSTKRMMAQNSENNEIIYDDIPNFGVLSRTFNLIDGGNDKTRVYERWRNMELNEEGTIKKIDSKDNRRDGDEGVRLSEFISVEDGNHRVNQSFLTEWIKKSKKNEPTKFLEGCYYSTEIDNVRELKSRFGQEYSGFVEDLPSSTISPTFSSRSKERYCVIS